MKNEKKLAEIMNENFVQMTRENQENINGGAVYRALYAVSPYFPEDRVYPLYAVGPIEKTTKPGNIYYSLYAVNPTIKK